MRLVVDKVNYKGLADRALDVIFSKNNKKY